MMNKDLLLYIGVWLVVTGIVILAITPVPTYHVVFGNGNYTPNATVNVSNWSVSL